MRTRSRSIIEPTRRHYADIRQDIKDCDVLLYRGRSLESRLIRMITRTPYSHAGLAVWWGDRLMVLEAVGRGVIVTPLSQNVRRYDGRVEWFTCVDTLSPETRRRMVELAQKELGKEYSTWGAIRVGLKHLLSVGTEEPGGKRLPGKLFCSLYVAAVYSTAGKDLKEGVSDNFTAPGDLASSPLLRRVAVLRKS